MRVHLLVLMNHVVYKVQMFSHQAIFPTDVVTADLTDGLMRVLWIHFEMLPDIFILLFLHLLLQFLFQRFLPKELTSFRVHHILTGQVGVAKMLVVVHIKVVVPLEVLLVVLAELVIVLLHDVCPQFPGGALGHSQGLAAVGADSLFMINLPEVIPHKAYIGP